MPERSQDRLERIERATDLPLMILALALVPVLVLPLVRDLPESVHQAFLAIDWMIWAVFTVVFVVKLTVAPNRWLFLRTHPLEALMVLLPFLRPFRVLRLVRLVRVATVFGVNTAVLQRLSQQRGLQSVLGIVVAISVAGALLGVLFERGAEGANITSFQAALWWSVVTMTTVGYGDFYPVTAAGRGVALALMLFGIAALSVVTASIAAFIVREDEAPAETRSQPDVDLLLERIDRLERKIDELSGRGA